MKSTILFCLVAAIVVLAVQGKKECEVDKDYLVKYVDALIGAGYLAKQEYESLELKSLVDLAIEGQLNAIKKKDASKVFRVPVIEFMQEQKELC